ncbi:MAG TPA: DUF503 domain-containing protein [Rectinemataceae bacterium]|nr:DUF503 domain-containing protein [Rectinemataceae bacterium]
MVVTLIQIVFELPEATSLKDKRSVVNAAKERIRRKFRISVAEVDLLDSLRFAQIGGALVSNSKEFGEKVMNAVLGFAEGQLALKVHDSQVHTEFY